MPRNEAETRSGLIDPALRESGWNEHPARIREEFYITAGRILGGGSRGKAMKADYILECKGKRLAVIEAKAENLHYSEGQGQAIEYALKLGLSFAYATNGKKILQIDLRTNKHTDIDAYPSPDELLALINEPTNQSLEEFEEVAFHVRGTEEVRYYQQIAVERALKAIANGDKRMLLTLATGTGKTRIAFQIAWKIFESRWNLQGDGKRRPRILFLADRNILANQAFNEFSAFSEDALVRIKPSDITKKGKVPTNGNIFFTIFQTFMSRNPNDEIEFNFGEYPKDFFDLIVVDECHRAGANPESEWRGILDYFSDAVHVGLTATPKRTENIDTYEYFGDPLFIYSLKEGVEDGFLTPFRVIKYASSIDEYRYVSDDEVLKGAIDENRTYKESDFHRVIDIPERDAYRVKSLIEKMDSKEKTIIFCANQAHALEIRDLINKLNLSTNAKYCVRVTSDEGEIGDQYLRDFQDNEKTIPTILTTSQKLSTGVDARNIRNIVLFRPVNSMIEFKQIIGRGTRLYDGKDYFTIHDFVEASFHFSDPEWDGEPIDPVPAISGKGDGGTGEPGEDPINETVEERVKPERILIKLADGKERLFDGYTTSLFYSIDGKTMSLTQFIESLFDTLPDFFMDEEELRKIWSVPQTRKHLLEQLSDAGFDKANLQQIQKLISAENCDLFDVLEYIKYNFSPVERYIRAKLSKERLTSTFKSNEIEFVDFLVAQYVATGVEELDEEKLQTLIEIKYKNVMDGVSALGGVDIAKKIFLKFQENLYLPHASYVGQGS
jgi:type I restriction enzyme R subunit